LLKKKGLVVQWLIAVILTCQTLEAAECIEAEDEAEEACIEAEENVKKKKLKNEFVEE